jgi:condensin complex subunit 1
MWFAFHREVGPAERSNLIIAVGDLTIRFPNLLEPWTAHIYQPLSDPDQGVPLLSLVMPLITKHIP